MPCVAVRLADGPAGSSAAHSQSAGRFLATTWLAQHLLNSPGSGPDARAAHKRLDRAQARYLAAIRALATTQKLLKPSLSPRDLAVKLVPETKVGSIAGQRQSADVAEGVPVLN